MHMTARVAAERNAEPIERQRPGAKTDDGAELRGLTTPIFPPDPSDLEARAAQALRHGDARTALRLADRRCRIKPHPKPHCFVLRAEAFDRLGLGDRAIADLSTALAIAPEDIPANRRLFRWGEGEDRLAAATTLARRDRDPQIRREAFGLLDRAGRRQMAEVELLERRIVGWAAWDGAEPVEVRVEGLGEAVSWRLSPDPDSPLRGRGAFACFDLPRPASLVIRSVAIVLRQDVIATVRTSAAMAKPAGVPKSHAGEGQGRVTVVVPVYGDYDATRLCIERLLESLPAPTPHRVVLVDDASPDPRISAYLRSLSRDTRVTVLVNEANLGFVGSINRALAGLDDGDVLLLNADTVVPERIVERLAEAARSTPGVGTVTPLSNNGEFLSFPVPNRSNPLPSLAELRALDEAASRCNAGTITDLPSGIGFCLYVTRACLDAVGALSETYHRGYLEDADFCLRAREMGFRNVGAASIFVGHAGSRSFARGKRALVVRNLTVLERRFPDHRAECAAFMAADPLRLARERIERVIAPHLVRPRLLVANAGIMAAIARTRAEELMHAGHDVLLLETAVEGDRYALHLSNPSGRIPQALCFELPQECDAFENYIRQFEGSRIELFDPLHLCKPVWDGLLRCGLPFDVFMADAQMVSAGRQTRGGEDDWLTAGLARAERLLVPCREAEALLDGGTLDHEVVLLDRVRRPRAEVRPGHDDGDAHLGLVPIFGTPSETDLIESLARRLRVLRPDVAITVLGSAHDERRLSAAGVFVTGPIEPSDFSHAAAAHGVTALIVMIDRPLFGHPAMGQAYGSELPVAAIDWSFGRVAPTSGDLSIDPRSTLEDTADHLARWLRGPGRPMSDAAPVALGELVPC